MYKLAVFLLGQMLVAQGSGQNFSQQLTFDVGAEHRTSGAYFRPAAVTSYSIGRVSFSAGGQFVLPGDYDRGYTSGQLAVGTFFLMGENFGMLHSVMTMTPFSDHAMETTLGLIFSYQTRQWFLRVGNAARFHGITRSVIDENGLDPDTPLRYVTFRNIEYVATYYFLREARSWNIGLGVSNVDNFRIHQELNPMLVMSSYTQVLPGFSMNFDLWFHGDGLPFLLTENRGVYGRIGFTWIPGVDY